MINKWSWGIALILVGLYLAGFTFQYEMLFAGVALVIAGVSGIAGV